MITICTKFNYYGVGRNPSNLGFIEIIVLPVKREAAIADLPADVGGGQHGARLLVDGGVLEAEQRAGQKGCAAQPELLRPRAVPELPSAVAALRTRHVVYTRVHLALLWFHVPVGRLRLWLSPLICLLLVLLHVIVSSERRYLGHVRARNI